MPNYRAIAFTGMSGSHDVVLTVAPADEIASWSGVPQRELTDGQETIGFQRTESPKRIDQIAAFFSDSRNVAQNPLLCAARSLDSVRFVADDDEKEASIRVGTLIIDQVDLAQLPLSELFALLESTLRERQPDLESASVGAGRLLALQDRLQNEHGISAADRDVSEGINAEESSDSSEVGDDELELFASETHVLEFWQEVKARQLILQNLEPEARGKLDVGESFLGFPRETLCSYLKPVLLVDGQHRLLGALASAEQCAERMVETDEFLESLAGGGDPEVLAHEAFRASCRLLPVSMLMTADVAEHVFQFVVVNQKATPVGKALIGTIVGTSLTENELASVSDRLEQAQINVTDSRAVAWFTRDPDSVFRGLVQQGLDAEGNTKLPWSVLKDLLSVFRTLSGGKLPSAPRNDYADLWRRRHLTESSLVEAAVGQAGSGEELISATAAWQVVDGPWRPVSNSFFRAVRDLLSDQANIAAPNAWGTTSSNLFNKVTLSILVADFFQFLTDSRRTINSADECYSLATEWLKDVDLAYFNRDWRLSGVKKDNIGIRKRWSEMWVDYRKDPARLPDVRNYRNAAT